MASLDTLEARKKETQAVYPTYEALRETRQWVRPAENSARRLYWPLDGRPLTESISVMARADDPDEIEPYYDQKTGAWHSIAGLPFTEPRISSITVRVRELEDWDDDWCSDHCYHTEPGTSDGDQVQWIKRGSPEGFVEGNKSVDEIDEDDEFKGWELLRCCGVPRPLGTDVSITVMPAADGEGFITIHDYLTAVQPWLVGLRQNIRAALGDMCRNDWPLPESTELMVNFNGLAHLMTEEKVGWVRYRKNR